MVITDVPGDAAAGAATPAGEPADDFFSSWDKPSIKKPTPPISRTGTPPVVGRTPSPFLSAGAAGNGITRSASPLSKSDSTSEAKPAAGKITTSAALRKTTTTGPRKANILGAKKTTSKLGAKKVADVIDFDEAEKRAKEEAERIEKLGYDPEAEAAEAKTTAITSSKAEASNVASPTPASTTSYSSSHTRQKSAAEIERLGMGFGRLGFGQVGGGKAAAAATATTGKKNAGGFGSVGPVKATPEGTCRLRPPLCNEANLSTADEERYARNKFGSQKGISSDEFFGKGAFDPNAQSEAKARLQGFEGATSISSNAYFGRPEEEDAAEDYGDLETAAKDFIRKFGITAGDDLDNLTSALGEGANRLQGAIRNYLNS